MPKVFTSKTQKTGEIGEHVAVRYLENKGFSIVERNYTKKWGEIDIVAQKGNTIYFLEVKSKTGDIQKIDEGHSPEGSYRPEDNMHPWKLQRLRRTIQTYILERKVYCDWQFGLIVVGLNPASRTAQVKLLENIIL